MCELLNGSADLLLNCTKYGKFNLWKIVKIVATNAHQMSDFKAINCTKFDFGWGFVSDPAGRAAALPRVPDPRS
jgi:hypothetical protein